MTPSTLAAALALVKEHLGDTAARELEISVADADRIKVIRDAFLEGRDHDAVALMRGLAKWGDIHAGDFRFLPTGTEVLIEPTQSAQITARPQGYAFQALALLVSERSRDFLINDIRVGMRSQFVQSGDMPADVLTPIPAALDVLLDNARAYDAGRTEAVEAVRRIEVVLRADVLSRAIVPIDCDVCLTAMDMVLVVTNTATVPLSFRAVWLGKNMPPPTGRDRDRDRDLDFSEVAEYDR